MAAKDPIGQQLLIKRKERRVSVPDLAELLQIPKDRIYKWEKGISSPKYEDKKIIEEWIKSGNWKNVPHETFEPNVEEERKAFISYSKGDDITRQTIFNLSESMNKQADAALLREQNYQKMIDHLTADGRGEIDIAVASKIARILKVIAEIASGPGKKWKNVEEAEEALNKLVPLPKIRSKEKGSHAGSGT